MPAIAIALDLSRPMAASTFAAMINLLDFHMPTDLL